MSTTSKEVRVAIIVDWEINARANLWPEVLQEIHNDSQIRLNVTYEVFPLADLIRTQSKSLIDELLARHDVLVINWDAVNGDPDFGADLAQRWYEHRRDEILLWVSEGNTLIVEGQATLGIPTQRAYDAVLGRNELIVCRAVDAWDR